MYGASSQLASDYFARGTRSTKRMIITTILCLFATTVNLSSGYGVKGGSGGVSGTFSSSHSASSASSFSHSSSSSFSGNFNGDHLGDLQGLIKAGSGTHSGAVAGSGALAGASAGSIAGSGVGTPGAHSGAGAVSGVVAGHGSGPGCSGGSSCAGGSSYDSNAISGSTASSDSDNDGSYKTINSGKYQTGYQHGVTGSGPATSGNYVSGVHTGSGGSTGNGVGSGCSGGAGCGGSTYNSNSGNYIQGTHAPGGCTSCKGPFPGPNGSIHDYKLASSVSTASSGATSHVGSTGSTGSSSYQPSVTPNLPGGSGSIYTNKPATGTSYNSGTSSSVYQNSGSSSGHVSPALIATFPGSPGSIHDSKPASGGFIHGSGSTANAGSIANAGSGSSYHSGSSGVTNIPSSHPVVGPACSYTPGSPNSCGGSSEVPSAGGNVLVVPVVPLMPAFGWESDSDSYSGSGSVSNILSTHPVVGPACSYAPGSPNKCGPAPSSGSSVANPLPVLPGPSGSIYDSKPASSVSSHGAGSSSGSQSGVSSICSYTPGVPNACGGSAPTPVGPVNLIPVLPGPSGSIYDSKPVSSSSGHGASSSSGSYNTGSGVVSGSVGPACSYTPGSPNYCGGSVPPSKNVVPILPGPSGSIYDSKPVVSASGHGSSSSTGSGSYSGSGSSVVPGSVGPSCSYTPGSPNYCGGSSSSPSNNVPSPNIIPVLPGPSGTIYDSKPVVPTPVPIHGAGAVAGAVAGANAAAQAGLGAHTASGAGSYHGSSTGSGSGSGSATVPVPSIHPEVPPTNTYYVNKPSESSRVPLIHGSPSFTGQVPCSGSTCGSGSSTHAASSSQSSYDTSKYSTTSVPHKPIYKNAESGGYAVSSNSDDNTGVLIGPGTGHLSLESGGNGFGSQGAFGGSSSFIKGSAVKENHPVKGIKGGHQPTSTYKEYEPCTSSSCSVSGSGYATGDVSIQKSDGTVISPVQSGNSGAVAASGSTVGQGVIGTGNDSGYSHGGSGSGCSGGACGFGSGSGAISGASAGSGSYGGSGCESGSCGGSGFGGSNSANGFATGQVLVQKGNGATYDVTNGGSSGSYAGAHSGSYTGSSGSGCQYGLCGGPGLNAFAGNGLLQTLFGPTGLSGANYKQGAGSGGFGGSTAFASSGSFAGSGSYAGAGAHSRSFAASF